MSASLRESGNQALDLASLYISVITGEIISLFSTKNLVGVLLNVVGFLLSSESIFSLIVHSLDPYIILNFQNTKVILESFNNNILVNILPRWRLRWRPRWLPIQDGRESKMAVKMTVDPR